ncbi:hypothetical protein ABK040_012953 [Willaertia magna]
MKYKEEAAYHFQCEPKSMKPFDVCDPFHPQHQLISGFIVKKDGPFGGSLYITHVNCQQLKTPQVVFGTPKLLYPYRKESFKIKEKTGQHPGKLEYSENIIVTKTNHPIKQFILANKWNGTNILFFKYFDANGKLFISAKTKGTPSISDSPQYGDFLGLTREALFGVNLDIPIDLNNPPDCLIDFIKREEVQSICFELCGKKEPHLVLYNFDICLKPLFLQHFTTGYIEPIVNKEDTEVYNLENMEQLTAICENRQIVDYEKNEKYRKEKNLSIRYEYEHFTTEGAVLYLISEVPSKDQQEPICCVSNRKLYKIKPKDIEEVHWEVFGEKQKSLIEIAIKKLKEREKEFSKQSLREELDIGPKEFSKYEEDIITYAQTLVGSSAFNRKSNKNLGTKKLPLTKANKGGKKKK